MQTSHPISFFEQLMDLVFVRELILNANFPWVIPLSLLSMFLIAAFLLPKKSNGRPLPPGPGTISFLANISQLCLFPYEGLAHYAKKWGPIMCVRIMSFPTVIVSSSEAAKQLLKAHDNALSARPPNDAIGVSFFNRDGFGMASPGEYLKLLKKTCSLHLFNSAKIESFATVRETQISSMLNTLWERSKQGQVAVNVTEAFTNLAYDFSQHVIVGAKNEDLTKLLLEAAKLLTSGFEVGDLIPCLVFHDSSRSAFKLKDLRDRIDIVLDKIIAEHNDNDNNNEGDLVDALLETSRENPAIVTMRNVKEVLTDLLIASIDATVATLGWCMSELVRNPHMVKILRQEIEEQVVVEGTLTEQSLAKMKYLGCFLKEVLRFYSPTTISFPRITNKDVEVMGSCIPKDTRVLFNYWAMGRDEKVWEEACVFKPERFMGDENLDIVGQSDFKTLPFGAGRRACPGYGVALSLIKVTLARMLLDFDWELEVDSCKLDMDVRPGFVVTRKTPLFLVPKRRKY